MSVHVVIPIAPAGAGKTFFRLGLARICHEPRLAGDWDLRLTLDTGDTDRNVWNDHYAAAMQCGDIGSTTTTRVFRLQVGTRSCTAPRTAVLMDLPGSTFFGDDTGLPGPNLRELLDAHVRDDTAEVSIVPFINQPTEPADPARSLDGPIRPPLRAFLGSASDRIKRVVFYYAAADRLFHKPWAKAQAATTPDELLRGLMAPEPSHDELSQNNLAGSARIAALASQVSAPRVHFMRSLFHLVGRARYSIVLSSAMGVAKDRIVNKERKSSALRRPHEWTPLYVLETLLFCCGFETHNAPQVQR